MKAYLDTSFLLSAYVTDANSAKAVSILRAVKGGIPGPPLVELELRNAVRLCAFRGQLTVDQGRQVLGDIERDRADGVHWSPPLLWPDVWHEAEALASAFTGRLGVRTLGLLHVAAARVLGVPPSAPSIAARRVWRRMRGSRRFRPEFAQAVPRLGPGQGRHQEAMTGLERTIRQVSDRRDFCLKLEKQRNSISAKPVSADHSSVKVKSGSSARRQS